MMGGMHTTFARGSRTAISKLLGLRRQAQKDKEPRVVAPHSRYSAEPGRTYRRRNLAFAEGASQHRSAVDRTLEPVWRGGLMGGTSQRAAAATEFAGARETMRHLR